jgi:hypothetical protein
MWRFLIPVIMLGVLVGFFVRGLFLNPSELQELSPARYEWFAGNVGR